MRREKKKTEKKAEYVIRVGMTVLTAILIGAVSLDHGTCR